MEQVLFPSAKSWERQKSTGAATVTYKQRHTNHISTEFAKHMTSSDSLDILHKNNRNVNERKFFKFYIRQHSWEQQFNIIQFTLALCLAYHNSYLVWLFVRPIFVPPHQDHLIWTLHLSPPMLCMMNSTNQRAVRVKIATVVFVLTPVKPIDATPR